MTDRCPPETGHTWRWPEPEHDTLQCENCDHFFPYGYLYGNLDGRHRVCFAVRGEAERGRFRNALNHSLTAWWRRAQQWRTQ